MRVRLQTAPYRAWGAMRFGLECLINSKIYYSRRERRSVVPSSANKEVIKMYGQNGRIGLLVPSVNTVVEPEFNRMIPEGINVYAARMRNTRSDVDDSKSDASTRRTGGR